MPRKSKREKAARGFTVKDILVVALSMIALVGLGAIVWLSGQDEQRMQQQLAGQRSTLQQAEPAQQAAVAACINEVNAAGWAELYNPGAAVANLGGYTLMLDGAVAHRFAESERLEAGSFLVVDTGAVAAGGTATVLALLDADGQAADQLLLPWLAGGESYARRADGGLHFALLDASRGESNQNAGLAPTRQQVGFSLPGGFYNEELALELSAPQGCDIYYTLDGTEPTEAAQRYEGPIALKNRSGSGYQCATSRGIVYAHGYTPDSICMGTAVKAVAVKNGVVVGGVQTQSYFIGFGGGAAFAQLPAISITAAPESLFDYFEGIYVLGQAHEDNLAQGGDGGAAANYLEDWSRPAHVEYFEPGKGKTYAAGVELSIWQDEQITSPQKGLRITANGQAVSPGSSLHPFFAADGKTLTLETHGRDSSYKFREAAAYQLMQESAVGTPALSACNVFINGEYWGVYLLRQPYDAKYVQQAYGVEESKVLLARDGVVDGKAEEDQALYDELVAYVLENDMADAEHFDYVCAQMDMESYLDCLCANLYLANASYRADPLVMWRSREAEGNGYADGRWRFLLPPLDNCMANGATGERCSYSINTFLQPGVTMDPLLAALHQNAGFRQRLAKKMEQAESEWFAPQRAADVVKAYSGFIRQASFASYHRFYGIPAESLISDEVEKIEMFFAQRGAYIKRYTAQAMAEDGLQVPTPEEEEEAGENTAAPPGQQTGQAG